MFKNFMETLIKIAIIIIIVNICQHNHAGTTPNQTPMALYACSTTRTMHTVNAILGRVVRN